MTFQEAQAQFSAIVAGITVGMSSAELVQKVKALQTLMNSVPNSPEFDPIADTIVEFTPKLVGQIPTAVLKSLQSRDASFRETTDLLTKVSDEASADARTLTFEKPRLVLASLEKSVKKLKELQGDLKAGNLQEAGAKAQALVALVEQARHSVKGA